MQDSPNSAQADFWNSAPGQSWVTFQDDFDAIGREAAELLMAAAAVRPGEHVLDIGCGSGATSLALAAAAGPAGGVLGVDISEPLLARARERARAAGAANLAFALADAQVHPFAPGGADVATSRFGVMFFADPVAAFANIARGLRPGGRLAFVVWAGPEKNPFFTLPMQAAVRRLGPPGAEDPDGPGPMAFRDPARVLPLLAAAGLVEARAEPVAAHLHHPGGLDGLLRFLPSAGPVSRLMREKAGTDADREAITADLATAFAGFVSPDGIRIPAGLVLYTARTPG